MRRVKVKGSKVKPSPLPLEVNEREFTDILRHTHERNMHHRISFVMSWQSGLRISEVVNLQPEDFNFESDPQSIRINMGKNSKDRIVNMARSIRPHHMSHFPIKCKQRALQKAFILAAIRSGLKARKPKIHFHNLRTGHATHSLRKGVNLSSIQGNLGHSDLSTTAEYLKLAPEERLVEYDTKF